jgi:hypothetical protein
VVPRGEFAMIIPNQPRGVPQDEAMTLSDLERAAREVLATGDIGTPVALRIHAAIPGFAGDAANALGIFEPLLRLISDESNGKVQARKHPSGKHLTVLWTDDRGRTVFITLTTNTPARQDLQVLLIGNHGITQLTGAEAWQEDIPPAKIPLWGQEIAQSLKQGTSIQVPAS